jgi:hypothetical protein
MSSAALKKALAALHDELSRASTLDAKSRQLLRDVMRDAERLGPSSASATDTLHGHRLEELAVGFEVEHPTLAAGLRQLIDLLAQAGL